MSKLTKDEVAHVASLARIELSDDELEKATTEVGAILGFVEKLEAVDTDGVKPTSQVTSLGDVWREDEVRDCAISRDDLLANAPATLDGYVQVKKVL